MFSLAGVALFVPHDVGAGVEAVAEQVALRLAVAFAHSDKSQRNFAFFLVVFHGG